MLVNSEFVEETEGAYEYIESLSIKETVTVQYPDGALWYVTDKEWIKGNNA